MKKFIYILFAVGFALQSCQDNADVTEDLLFYNKGDIVLQPRSSLLPTYAETKSIKKIARSEDGIIRCNSDEYLGLSCCAGNSILGDASNARERVLDLDYIKSKSPRRITSKQINESYKEVYMYDDLESYQKMALSGKFSTTGFSVNLGLFKLGRKTTHTAFFKDSIISSSRVVYGEMNISNRNKSYSLSTTTSDLKYYARECLDPSFLGNLYESTISNIINQYGEMVMMGYVTGGRLFSLYAGLHKESTELTIKAKDMGQDLNASVFFDKDTVGSVTLKIGNGCGSAVKTSGNITQLQTHLLCLGGDQAYAPVAGTVTMKDFSLDLTPWWRSLSDESTHSIVDITKNGLAPLSAFVLEGNFQRRIDDTVDGFLPAFNKFITPYIEIVKVLARNTSGPVYEVAPVLNTRNGDKIILSDGLYQSQSDSELRSNINNNVYDSKVMEILPKLREYFPYIRIVKNYDTKYNLSVRVPLCIRMDGFDASSFVRHTESTGMVYLYDKNKKIAFSYYEDAEPLVMEAYGMEDWISSIPEEDSSRPLSMSLLANLYNIVGL